jgi:type I site-specific restriction-modification system R (restriction) subunit
MAMEIKPYEEGGIWTKRKSNEFRKSFSNPGELPKIPIVRGKLLTGYDAPVLYAIRARC